MAIMARTFTTKPAGCTFDAQREGEDMNRIIVGILGAALIAGPALAKGKHPNIGAAHQFGKQPRRGRGSRAPDRCRTRTRTRTETKTKIVNEDRKRTLKSTRLRLRFGLGASPRQRLRRCHWGLQGFR